MLTWTYGNDSIGEPTLLKLQLTEESTERPIRVEEVEDLDEAFLTDRPPAWGHERDQVRPAVFAFG